MQTKTKQILFWIVLIGAGVLLNYVISDMVVKLIIFFVGVATWLRYQLNTRIQKLEDAVHIVQNPIKKQEPQVPLSYKLKIGIIPEWRNIMKKLAAENNEDVDTFLDGILKDESLGINRDRSLYGEWFGYTYFYHGLSSVEQIWSDYRKTFVENMVIRGDIFDAKGMMTWLRHDKYKNNSIAKVLEITPEYVGFSSNLPNGEVLAEGKLSQIPFWEIVRFLKDIHQNCGFTTAGYYSHMCAIKKFPQELEAKLDKHGVKYDKWDYEDYGVSAEFKEKTIKSDWADKNGVEIYEQPMRNHVFSTSYYCINFSMEVFE